MYVPWRKLWEEQFEASKYSPVMELHPVLGANVEEKHKTFLADWKG